MENKFQLVKFNSSFAGSNMLIYDRESNDIVEDFPVANIHRPIAFSHSNHIYDNILMFTVRHVKESEGSLVDQKKFILKLFILDFQILILIRKFAERAPVRPQKLSPLKFDEL